MSSSVEQIKERLSVNDVVGSYVKLEKAGSNYKAKCPFHNEKTPSFFVSPSRGSYYCFGCNAKGDIFSFVEQFEGLDFVGALKVLAQRAGVELVRENPKVRNERERLHNVLESAAKFFEESLSASSEALEYLATRGVREDTVRNWRLGFAPDEWNALHDALLKRGFSPDEMLRAGLVKHSEKSHGGHYDVFRGRIMFPIFDSSGRVIAFSGRILPRLDDGKSGKYINSPETALWSKSRVLYGLHKAKFDIRKRDYSIMVEGQMDLIMSHQAGLTNTIAVSGTALTTETSADGAATHLEVVRRLSNNIILAFDSDEAGFKASARNAHIALSLGMEVKVAKMPAGDDPAEIILRNSEEWKDTVRRSKHVIDFTLETILEKKIEPRKLGKEVETLVLPYISVLRSAIDRSHFIAKIAKDSGIKEEALWEELSKRAPAHEGAATPSPVYSVASAVRKDTVARRVFGILYYLEGSKTKFSIVPGVFRARVENILGPSRFAERAAFFEGLKSELIFEAEERYGAAEALEREAEELLINLEAECVETELTETIEKLSGGGGGDQTLVACIHELSLRREQLRAKRENIGS